MRYLAFLDKLDPFFAVLIFGTLSIAPIWPEPHLVEKFNALMNGAVMSGGMPMQMIDYFDILIHGGAFVLLVLRFVRLAHVKKHGLGQD